MHKDAALNGDEELAPAFWTLSSFVAAPFGTLMLKSPYSTTSWSEQNYTWRTCETDTLGCCTMAPKSNVLPSESLRTRPKPDLNACFLDLRVSSYEVLHGKGHRSVLKLSRDIFTSKGQDLSFPSSSTLYTHARWYWSVYNRVQKVTPSSRSFGRDRERTHRYRLQKDCAAYQRHPRL